MKTIKELFRLRFQVKLSQRKVGQCLGCGRSTVQDYEKRAFAANLDSYEKIQVLSEDELRKKRFATFGFSSVRMLGFSSNKN